MPPPLSLLRTIDVDGSSINCAQWSESGKLLACALQSGDVIFLNSFGRRVSTIRIGDTALDLSWSPDERFVALATAHGDVLIGDITQHRIIQSYQGHTRPVYCVAYSPNGEILASGGGDGRILLCHQSTHHAETHKVIQVAISRSEINSLAWASHSTIMFCANDGLVDTIELPEELFSRSSDTTLSTVKKTRSAAARRMFADSMLCIATSQIGKIAVAGKDGSIYLFENSPQKNTPIQIFEGHTDWVWSLEFALEDRLLISEGQDETIRMWDAQNGALLFSIQKKGATFGNSAVHAKQSLIAIPKEDKKLLELWRFDGSEILGLGPQNVITHCSAKVALVGESNVGKSCLALRLAEGRYEEQGTTHGMRFWPITPEMLDPNDIPTDGIERDVVLWDMGGQDEYRLIHELFLHDTTVALILLDPTRGRTAFEEAEGWSKRLEKQLAGTKAGKLLVGTKLDSESDVIDQPGLERLLRENHFDGYYPTSAKTGRGIADLGTAISIAIDWGSLSQTTRPYLFQVVRDQIDRARSDGEVVLLRKELESRVRKLDIMEFDAAAVNTVVSQLALQGLIAVTRLASREQAIVLQVQHIEAYAGSVLIAARNNPRGIPAIQELDLMSEEMTFPGLIADQRLPRPQERVVLECLVQLCIEHGICIEHEGLLVFPSLFQTRIDDTKDEFAHSVSLYYDFSGAIDNIYSSLVSAITFSDQFGAVRMWDNRAEFAKAGQGICGLRKVARQRGFAHLDVYVSDEVSEATRDLFVSVVEEHLAHYGIDIYEHVEVACSCGHQFSEETIRKRIADGHSDVGCPACDTRARISEGAKQARLKDPELERRTWALRSQIKKRKTDAV